MDMVFLFARRDVSIYLFILPPFFYIDNLLLFRRRLQHPLVPPSHLFHIGVFGRPRPFSFWLSRPGEKDDFLSSLVNRSFFSLFPRRPFSAFAPRTLWFPAPSFLFPRVNFFSPALAHLPSPFVCREFFSMSAAASLGWLKRRQVLLPNRPPPDGKMVPPFFRGVFWFVPKSLSLSGQSTFPPLFKHGFSLEKLYVLPPLGSLLLSSSRSSFFFSQARTGKRLYPNAQKKRLSCGVSPFPDRPFLPDPVKEFVSPKQNTLIGLLCSLFTLDIRGCPPFPPPPHPFFLPFPLLSRSAFLSPPFRFFSRKTE